MSGRRPVAGRARHRRRIPASAHSVAFCCCPCLSNAMIVTCNCETVAITIPDELPALQICRESRAAAVIPNPFFGITWGHLDTPVTHPQPGPLTLACSVTDSRLRRLPQVHGRPRRVPDPRRLVRGRGRGRGKGARSAGLWGPHGAALLVPLVRLLAVRPQPRRRLLRHGRPAAARARAAPRDRDLVQGHGALGAPVRRAGGRAPDAGGLAD